MDQRHLHISCIFNTHHAYTSCIHISCTHNSMHTTDTHNTHTTRTHITALEPHVDTTNVFHRHIHTYPHTSTHIHTHHSIRATRWHYQCHSRTSHCRWIIDWSTHISAISFASSCDKRWERGAFILFVFMVILFCLTFILLNFLNLIIIFLNFFYFIH